MADSKQTATEPVVKLRGLYKKFDKVLAVQPTDLDIEEGHLVTLLGPSGCGKTTILRMIAGLENPSGGDIFIKGKRMNDVPIHKRNLGMIFQNYALFPHKTIFDNVAFGLKYRDVSKDEVKDRVANALEMVRLPGVEKRMPSQLSGGQQQRIALARAIVIEPDVLLMDEPLSALDENLREEMRREIDNLQIRLGLTTVFVTHDQREALSMSNKIVVMQAGQAKQVGTPEEVYNYPANYFVADFLGHSNFFDATIVRQEGEHTVVRTADGSELVAHHPGDWKPGEDVTLVIRAQKINVYLEGEEVPESKDNVLHGVIQERSYMGGEVSYFIDLDSGVQLHVISMVKINALKVGNPVHLQVEPRHCGILKKES